MQEISEDGVTSRRYLQFLGLILFLSGCAQTTYSPYEKSHQEIPAFSRNVQFNIGDGFFRDPPNCITVLPVQGSIDGHLKRIVENAVARHLSGKVKRIIGPNERQILERRLAFDLEHPGDRRRFTQEARCRHFAQPEIKNADRTYVLVWTQKYLNLSLSIHGDDEKKLIWRASHQASRGDGGIPLSPLSLGAALFSAGRAHNDQDTFPSMVDDSFRRMLIKFPDTRQY